MNDTYNWIKAWFSNRIQQILLDGITSSSVAVTSGVPQGTVLHPLMFLLYINDITINIKSPLRIFADDCLLYRVINSPEDTIILQQDLDQISDWVKIWQLRLNVTKCALIRCSRSLTPIVHHYTLNNSFLKEIDQHLYLGIMLNKTLSWLSHISNIAKKASNTLNFIKRNLSDCSREVKAQAYLTMVRPQMEFASVVWDPCYNVDVDKLEKIQRRAARWVISDCNRTSSVTQILNQLSWPTLRTRRKISRLQLLHKVLHQDISLNSPILSIRRETNKTLSSLAFYPAHTINNILSTIILLKINQRMD